MKTFDLPIETIIYLYGTYHSTLVGFDVEGRMLYKEKKGNIMISTATYNNNNTEDWSEPWTFEVPKTLMFKSLYDRLKD